MGAERHFFEAAGLKVRTAPVNDNREPLEYIWELRCKCILGKGFLCPGAHLFCLVVQLVISVPCCVFYIIKCLVGTLAGDEIVHAALAP